MVAIKAIPSLTTSCVSELRCFLGTSARKNMPSSAPVKTHPNTMHAIATELSIYPQDVEMVAYSGGVSGGRCQASSRRARIAEDRIGVLSLVALVGCGETRGLNGPGCHDGTGRRRRGLSSSQEP